MGNMGLYIGPTYEVQGDCLRTLTRMETKGICLYKQAMNVEDSFRTIVMIIVDLKLNYICNTRNIRNILLNSAS